MPNPSKHQPKINQDVTLIATVYNERDTLLPFLRSISAQTMLPAQIVMVDGGSTDGTYGLLKDYFGSFWPQVAVEVVQKKGAGISQGRNTAISRARGPFICVSDGGCIIHRRWLEVLTGQAKPETVTAGYSASWAKSFFQKCLAASIMPLPGEIKTKRFMPSSRNVCFPKQAWAQAGGYPQHLDFGEDMKFNFALKECGYRIRFLPRAVVYWKMREGMGIVFKQFFRYAKGDALGAMYPLRHMVRFAALAVLAAVIVLSVVWTPYVLLVLPVLGAAYCFQAFRRIPAVFYKQHFGKKMAAVFAVPFLLACIDGAKMAGYLYGQCIKRNK